MLKKRNVAVNILTGFAAVLLSILLVLCLMVTSIYGVMVGSVSAKSISNMIRTVIVETVEGVDFEEAILKNETVKQNVEELNISTDAVGQLMQSDAANEVIDLLSADIANILAGREETSLLTAEALIGIVKEHADDLADIAVEMTDEPLHKEELKAQIIETIERDADKLTEAMPNVQTIRKELVKELPMNEIGRLLNPALVWAAYGVCLLLALLIYACRWYRFGGFCWIGVDSLLAGGLLAAMTFVIRLVSEGALVSLPDNISGIIRGLIGRVHSALQVRMYVCLGAAVVLITTYILLKNLVVKKKLAAAMTAPISKVVEQPVAVIEEPVEIVEEPTEATEEPVEIVEEPAEVVEE